MGHVTIVDADLVRAREKQKSKRFDHRNHKIMAEVGIIMGSASDFLMQAAIDVLKELNIAHEVDIVSAHRTPEK